ncbi:alpha/beta hydrolase [Ureibacillus acetophenoni]|uniref:Phospholipase/carboxylesterase n=1 Tax=Ureibacillus acetophenoni TaxID=614649 RepID=A0A285UEG2_9BACL|nr:dienelactone hydrolase family protein [Ureibacillus acetophenoni]SOC40153.1 phospholipase/carboxylesterase [Ureibacillus acetophenoni]
MNTNLVYTLSKPTNTDKAKHPAIFLMHGMGSNESDLPSIVQELRNDYYIFSLRGPLSQPPGYSFFTIERIGLPHEEPFKHILNEIQQFIEEAKSQYDIDENGIYLMGFSQGGILSQSLASIMGNKLAGIVSLSGYLPEIVDTMEKSPMDGLRVFLAHGEQDQIIPFTWSEKSKQYFEGNHAEVSYHPYTGGHFLTQEVVNKILTYFKG